MEVFLMKYAMYTTSENAEILVKKLHEHDAPVYIIERTSLVPTFGEKFCNIPVISIYEAISKHKSEFQKILVPSILDYETDYCNLRVELNDAGFSDSDILYAPIEFMVTDASFRVSDCVEYSKLHYMRYLEFQIVDRCNLNCACCSHFTNLTPNAEDPLYCDLVSDLTRLRELVSHVYRIRIMGGEPLMSPHLCQYIALVRKLFPYSDIRIATNGILLNSLNKETRLIIRENKVTLDFSVYPVMFKKVDDIVRNYTNEGVFVYPKIVSKFLPVLLHQKQPYPFKHLECPCTILRQGKIAPCALILFINVFNEKYETSYPDAGGKYDIYRSELTYATLMDELIKPFSLCDYCNLWIDYYCSSIAKLEYRPWRSGISGISKNDWVL
jgi:MoaA/NifB/PqqE/SkfB family radical SAM enzyme